MQNKTITVSVSAHDAAFELLRRKTNHGKTKGRKTPAQNHLAMSMTAEALRALTVDANLVTTPAKTKTSKSIKSKSAQTKVTSTEVSAPQAKRRGPAPLNSPELSKLRDSLYQEFLPTWRVADANGVMGRAHYMAACAKAGIVTRSSLKAVVAA